MKTEGFEAIAAAEIEALRFVGRVDQLRKAMAASDGSLRGCVVPQDAPSENAAMKRASLDLTRSLAKLRRPGQ